MTMDRIAVVGASLAGLRAAEALRHEGFSGELALVGEEQHFPPYDRPPLSKEILKGLWGPDRGRLKVADDLDAKLVLGRRAVGLHGDRGEIELDDGSAIAYDGLVVATGASPKVLPTVDPAMPGVFVLRTFDESVALRDAIEHASRVVIIGAGWIGCEVAATCRDRDIAVTIVEYFDQPLERTLGPVMGAWAGDVHRAHGVDLRCRTGVIGVKGEGRAEQVELDDGTTLAADVVVLAIGVAPETGWLEGNGLNLDNGILCDETLRAEGARNIVAAGDVCRWPNPMFDRIMRVEHWSNAVEQAAVAAHTLLHDPAEARPYSAVPYVWSDQYDLKLQYVGTSGEFHSILEGSLEDRKFVAGYASEGVLVGALCVNSPARMIRYKRFLAAHPAIDTVEDNLP